MEEKITFEEALGTLNAYDEDDIQREWGIDILDPGDAKPYTVMRSMIWKLECRTRGFTVDDAKRLTVKEIQEYFVPVDPEGDKTPTGELTEQGKESSAESDESGGSLSGA